MSLQRTTPKQSISAMDAPTALEKSYSRSLIEHAWRETREHNKVELIAGLIVGAIGGLLAGGFAWSSFGWGFLVYLATLLTIFFIHLLRSPKSLDRQLREQLKRSETQAEIDSLTRQLDEINKPKSKHKLTFEIHTRQDEQGRIGQGRAFVKHEQYTFAPPNYEPVEEDYYLIQATLNVHFENKSTRSFTFKKLTISLFRETGSGAEKELPYSGATVLIMSEMTGPTIIAPGIVHLEGEKIKRGATDMTKPYSLHCSLRVAPRYGKRFNQNCFLRITLESVEQNPYWVDFNVDWETACASDKGVLLTPRKAAF